MMTTYYAEPLHAYQHGQTFQIQPGPRVQQVLVQGAQPQSES